LISLASLPPKAVTAALVTGTAGPRYTHVPLGAEAELSQYEESYADATDLHTIPQPRFHRRRGRLAGTEMASLERAIRPISGCDPSALIAVHALDPVM